IRHPDKTCKARKGRCGRSKDNRKSPCWTRCVRSAVMEWTDSYCLWLQWIPRTLRCCSSCSRRDQGNCAVPWHNRKHSLSEAHWRSGHDHSDG
ncbi:hypothetical protein GGI11_008220, partial [Coemansia sp. RSA 2049]